MIPRKERYMKETTSLVFTGDIGFDKYMDGKWDDEALLSDEVLDYLHSGNHVIANVEGALMDKPHNETEGVAQLVHCMNPKATNVLDKMHADIWNLCNNHIMDCSDEGVEKTLEQAKLHNAKTIGAGMNIDEARKPLYLDEAGGIGLFACGFRRGCKPAGENKAGTLLWNEMEMIQENITEIKKKCRWCIMVVHGGEEFTALPTPYTRNRYLKFLEMGADIIVAHHPHVPMNYETVGDKIIFYSLGNFIFDTDYQRAQFNTEKGILVKLNLNEDTYTWDAIGLKIDRETEHVSKDELPKIFEDVQEDEYNLLEPLAAKMFISATKRQQIYLNPKEFKEADDKEWEEHFSNEKRPGRVVGEALDFLEIVPLSKKAEEGKWKESKLEGVKEFILEQM